MRRTKTDVISSDRSAPCSPPEEVRKSHYIETTVQYGLCFGCFICHEDQGPRPQEQRIGVDWARAALNIALDGDDAVVS